jgi:hypothetical protein
MNTISVPAASGRHPVARRRWPQVLLLLLFLLLALALAGLWTALSALQPMPLNISIDGEQVARGLDLAALPPAHKLVFASVALVVLLSALVILPLTLLIVLLGALLLAVLAVGLPVLAVLVLAGVLMSPLLLVLWLLWRALRPAPSSTMRG